MLNIKAYIKLQVSKFYTAPTAIRALMKFGEEFAQKYDLSTLKVLGTVGEPINPEAWLWYHKYVGSENCSIVDTYWQVDYYIICFVFLSKQYGML